MSSGQGGLLRASSEAHSFELGAEALCGRVRFGEGPVEKCLGYPRVGLQAAQGAPEHLWWAWLRLAGPLRRPGSGAALGAAEAVDPGHRCGGAGFQPLEASEALGVVGHRAVLPAFGSPQVAVPASTAGACCRGSVWGGGECEYCRKN